MEKFIIVLFVLVLAYLIVRRSKSSDADEPVKGKYVYRWSSGAGSALSVKAAEDVYTAGYSGSSIPPYGSIMVDENTTQGVAALETYWEEEGVLTPVISDYTCDEADGSFTINAGEITVFLPKRVGICIVTATWNGNTLQIPILVYRAINLDRPNKKGFSFDTLTYNESGGDFYLPSTGLYTRFTCPFGYQILTGTYISNVTSAPSGDYVIGNADLEAGQVLIVKTFDGKYAKVSLISVGFGVTLTVFVSDENGNFEY